MATRKVSVTSVTPRATVTARTKAQQARTRKLVGTIAAVTPVGRLATGAIKASRTTGIAGFGAAKTPAQNFGKYAQISDVKSKTARKIGDKISGASSKKVQKKLNEYANADVRAGRIDRDFATHPGSLSYKGNQKVRDPKAKFPTARESVRYRKAEDKKDAAASARGLKAANKPTKASKTFIGSNKNLSPSVRRDIIVNQTKPARPNRERGGTLKTLRKQGKTGTSK
jgi:hypothetical protein